MSESAITIEHGDAPWGAPLELTGLILSMAVNALATGLIVFKILGVFWEVKSASVERTLGSESLSSTGGTKLRHIIFIIIESGMALFAIQLVRVVITSLSLVGSQSGPTPPSLFIASELVIRIHQMLNVINIRSVSFFTFY